jgi:hypothetical protein
MWRIFKAREDVQLALERDGIEVEVSRQPARGETLTVGP